MGDFTSDLVDPATADLAWLPWLAQLVSVRLDSRLTETQQRQAIADAASGWRAGTKASIAAAARLSLTGSKTADVLDHTVAVAGDGTMWDITVVTLASETPDSAAMLATIRRLGVVPAGCALHNTNFTATWATIEASRPTWDDWDSSTWTQIEETT